MGKTFFLHVGLHKTATTYLQDKVFPLVENTFYRHRDEMRKINRTGRFKGWRIDRDFEIAFSRSPAFWDDFGEELLESTLSIKTLQSNQNILVSSEGMAGARIFLRNIDPIVDPFTHVNDPYLFSQHLSCFKKLINNYGFTNLKVILTIRRQDQWFASNYAQYSHIIPNSSQQDFEKQVSHMLDPKYRYYWEGIWANYLLVCNCIERSIGKNLLILPIEELSNKPERYFSRLSTFLDEPRIRTVNPKQINKNKTSLAPNVWKIKDREFYIRPFKYIDKYSRTTFKLKIPNFKKINLTNEFRFLIKSRFRTTNRELDGRGDLSLNNYGYY